LKASEHPAIYGMKSALTRARRITQSLVHRFSAGSNLRHISTSKTGLESKPLYTHDGNYWIKTQGAEEGNQYTVDIGLTKHAFDTAIAGSIDLISFPADSMTPLRIHWSGLKVGTGDELYHSIWENVDGIFEFEPFLPIKLSAITEMDYNIVSVKNSTLLDEDEWLVSFKTDDSKLQVLGISLSSMKTQEQHDAFCDFSYNAAQSS
jgi:hypothetical protein